VRVLIVEDEVALASALKKILESNHILTDVAHDGIEGQMLADHDAYDVIVLDLMLPGKSGLDILQAIRRAGKNVPVLLLTARDSTADKVKGLNMGADDYVVKPFVTEELVARIQALGRRPWEVYKGKDISFADLILDTKSGELLVDQQRVKLTAKEAQLLEMFLRNPGVTISKEQILDRIWGFDSYVMENSVEIYIHYIRKKIKKSQAEIKTKRGMGYFIREKADAKT